MKYFLALLVISLNFSFFLQAEDNYEFIGRHLVISYMDCDHKAIFDEETLKEKMKEAALASGVTILTSSHHHFEPNGVTQVLLLSESHASVHSYPECHSCFVDLFTCGTTFAMDKFDQVMSEYLQPGKTSHRLLHRQEDCRDLSFVPLVQATTP